MIGLAQEAPPVEPPPVVDWSQYISTNVRRVTSRGAATTVWLLQVKSDAAHVRTGKKMKPIWIPLKELQLFYKPKKVRVVADQNKPNNGERYVLVDMNHHRFFWAGKGRGSDPKWVENPDHAVTYMDNSSAWSARGYHRKKRPASFPSHIEIKGLSDAAVLYAKWRAGAADPVGKMARDILDKSLPNLTPARPLATSSPAPTALFEAWAAKRREVAAAESMAASVRAELAELEAQLDIDIKRSRL